MMNQTVALPTDYTPTRLRKLMLRLAQLAPGMAYTVTLIIPEDGEPAHVITPLGKVENGYRQSGRKVLE